ncbi:uncharacterized protein N7483_007691 [Penicillium malachiteum]|uniref:uncharacterized protein n=1 Tax=Penicillium malachiteum TaxID=1324776 RepID=UPI0025481792|nr:uncharacterized protein N7483_007691 [Penicillium malachiteum]KAJ5726334.1 hypothetical protein N7483_007691 [Penicillium malachiteum]
MAAGFKGPHNLSGGNDSGRKRASGNELGNVEEYGIADGDHWHMVIDLQIQVTSAIKLSLFCQE